MRLLPAVIVGLLWGSTNSLIKLGSDKVRERLPAHASALRTIAAHFLTPAFIVPQALNQAGSVLFIYLLGYPTASELSVLAPLANVLALVFNALTDLALGQRYHLLLLGSGLALVATGVVLVASS
jgi:hypothetical protein